MAKARRKAPRYQPHPMVRMEREAREEVEAGTERTWRQWLELTRRRGPRTEKAIRAWLQEEHGFAPRSAQWLAYGATHPDAADYDEPEPLVDALYSGAHAGLRAVHEAVVDAMIELGDDVVVTACKTMVPVYRRHVFAEMRPVDGAVEVQLALGDVAAKGRLSRCDGRMPGDRLTHRVLVRGAREVDAEVRGWLAVAYEHGAGKMTRSTAFEVPGELAKALRASRSAAATWERMTPAMRRDLVLWVTSAKQADTRARRLGTAIETLAAGRKRVY